MRAGDAPRSPRASAKNALVLAANAARPRVPRVNVGDIARRPRGGSDGFAVPVAWRPRLWCRPDPLARRVIQGQP